MDALPQNWKPYRPLIPAAALLAAGGWLLFGSGGKLPFTSEVIGSECRRLEVLRKNILELREQNRQLEAEIRPLAAIRAGAAAGEKEAAAEKLRESVERIAAASGATVSSARDPASAGGGSLEYLHPELFRGVFDFRFAGVSGRCRQP